ncbi:MAG TPA: protein kinase [Vicinamibacteria bacterium]|nr:protein kinase [Vicinamibacteria bacterium]
MPDKTVRYCPSCHSVFPNEFRTCPKDQTDLLTASELQPGMVLRGKYEILGKLGAGGMAAVYRARHLAFGEVRAIKVVNNRLADDEEFLRRFRNEAVVARRLQHPNAVRVDDLDMTEDGRPFIVMEYVEGQNLREVVRHQGALSLRRAVVIARQVAAALAAAHELGIIHRDIKPDNILLTGTGEAETAKVLDFGIAKMKESALGDSGAVATRTGMVVGTPQYISPEQAMGRRGSDLDGRADLYSLGVVLYEMVTGRLPFESDTAMGIILHHLQTPPPEPREVRPDLGIPDSLSAVLMRALQKEPDKRFPSATAMATALQEVLATLPEDARATEADGAGTARPLTPPPIPFDIDRHETRVMPRTPPVPGRAPLPAAATARSTPPPIPQTPAPAPTMAAVAPSRPSWTPVPSPTMLTSAGGSVGGRATPPPLPPPPLPGSPTTVFEPPGPRRRGKRRWWLGLAAAAVFLSVFHRDASKTKRRDVQPSPSPAAGDSVDGDLQAVQDAAIAVGVQRQLRANPRTRRQDIDVDVEDGVVRLSGKAPAAAAREAEAMARHVDGVKDVASTIDIEEAAAPERAEGSERPENPERAHGPHPPAGEPRGLPVPPMPPFPRGRPSPDAAAVQRVLREAHASMKAGQAGEAMAKFGAVLGMDPSNEEAKQGLKDATILLGENIRKMVPGARPSPG